MPLPFQIPSNVLLFDTWAGQASTVFNTLTHLLTPTRDLPLNELNEQKRL